MRKVVFKTLGLWFGFYVTTRLIRQVAMRLGLEGDSIFISSSLTLFCLLSYVFVFRLIHNEKTWGLVRPKRLSVPLVLSMLAQIIWGILYLGNIRYDWSFVRSVDWSLLPVFSLQFLSFDTISPASEELADRGVLQYMLTKQFSDVPVLFFQAMVFTAMHFVGVADGHMDFWRTVSTFLLGLSFGYQALCTGGLFWPWITHVAWNLVSTFLFRSLEG